MSEPPSIEADYYDAYDWRLEETATRITTGRWLLRGAARSTSSAPLDSDMAACRGCGRARHVNPQRGHADYCRTCQHLYDQPALPDFTGARCVGHQDVSDLAHEPINTPGAREARRQMLEWCHACPIRQACLDWRMATETSEHRYGVWGGMTPIGRRRLARERGTSAEEKAA